MTLLVLTVLVFPKLLRPDLSAKERAGLVPEKLVAAENDRSNAQNNIRATLLQGIAGVALLTGAYFTYRPLGATREGQITTRYTEAVKQLGDEEHLDIRIGGIYALQRIARDSQRDAHTVLNLLSAFVRRARPVQARAGQPPQGPTPELAVHAPDEQIALEIAISLSQSDPQGHIQLFNADLSGADLSGAHLI